MKLQITHSIRFLTLIVATWFATACGGSDPVVWQGNKTNKKDSTNPSGDVPKGDTPQTTPNPTPQVDDNPDLEPNQNDPAQLCNEGESKFASSCYRLITGTDMTFTDAQRACEQQGAKVVSIEDDLEDNFVFRLIPDHLEVVWIGLKRTAPGASSWVWESGAMPVYSNWANGEPNNENGIEECSVMWGPALIYPAMVSKWNDAPCNEVPRDTVICEREL